jgi:hypothetical protein
MSTRKELRTKYDMDLETSKVERMATAERLKKTNSELQGIVNAAKNKRVELGEHAQVDEAVLLSIISGFGAKIAETIYEFQQMMQEAKLKGLDEHAKTIQGAIENLKLLDEKANKHYKYHTELLPKKLELEKKMERISTKKDNEGLTQQEEKELQKNITEMAKITNDIKDIQEYFGAKDEQELVQKFAEAEGRVLETSENGVAVLREGMSGLVEDAGGSASAKEQILQVADDLIKSTGIDASSQIERIAQKGEEVLKSVQKVSDLS